LVVVNIFGDVITVFHAFNSFLSTSPGELAKRVVELVISVVVIYMIMSEYGRSRRNELKYLLMGFVSLGVSRLIMTSFYLFVVFGKVNFIFFEVFLPIIIEFLDIFALILVSTAFLYPYIKKNVKKALAEANYKIFALLMVSLAIQVSWFIFFRENNTLFFNQSFGFFVFELVKLLVLVYPCYVVFFNPQSFQKYRLSIFVAFFVYAIYPIVNIINIVFFNYANPDLRVFVQPFPFLATLLFTRIIYLKLVDKAYLTQKLEQTEQKYMHEKELGKLKDEFVSTVSHELRTPITSMKLYLALLKQGKMGAVNKKQKEAIRIVDDEISRLNYLINDILNLSKLETGKIKLEKKKTNIHDLAQNNMYAEMAKRKNNAVVNTIPKNLHAVVDPEKFRQVVINLFSNAVKFTDNGTITLSASLTNNEFIFRIKDTGIGIPDDKVSMIFDKFYQVDEHMTRKEGGSGLGLSIVEKIVQLHNGTISVHSILDKGTEFVVRIPQ
jgi:signal transduction histidine kinase